MRKAAEMYDRTEVYKKEIEPLIKEINQICAVKDIPYFMAFAVKDSEKSTKYVSEGNIPSHMDINPLKDDKFGKFLAVLRGFEVVPLGARMDELNIDEGYDE